MARRNPLPLPAAYFRERLMAFGERLRDAIVQQRAAGSIAEASTIVREAGGVASGGYAGDTIYAIDERGETVLLDYCASWARELERPFILVAEGLPGDGRRVWPDGADPADAIFEWIVDPIDGTRCLMYDKRSAWVLSAVAPGEAILGQRPALNDLAVAVQIEVPTSRARLADVVWAVVGEGAQAQTLDLATGTRRPARLAPSRATTLAHGYAAIAKFFPGTKEAAAWIEERLFAEVVGEHAGGAPLVFDDEYTASGGQLYELMMGHDRFIADLRPVLMDVAERRAGHPPAPLPAETPPGSAPRRRRLCARPYDLCTALIAQEAGVVVTDAWGRALSAPLDTMTDVAWAGYANEALRRQIEPVLQRLLRELGAPAPE